MVILNTPLERSCNRLQFDIKTLSKNKAWKCYDSICKKPKKWRTPPPRMVL